MIRESTRLAALALALACGWLCAAPAWAQAPTLAIADLENHTGDTSLDAAGAGVASVLISKFARVEAVQVVERARLQELIGELELVQAGVVDPATAAEAGRVLGADYMVLGSMMSVVSLGALVCTLRIASMSVRNRGRTVLLGNAALGVVIVAFAFSDTAWLSFPLLLCIGAGQSLRNSLSNVLSQTYVDDAFRGRVMSLVAMQMNAAQLGTFAFGMASEALGARVAFAGMGAGLLVMSAWFTVWFAPMRRLH